VLHFFIAEVRLSRAWRASYGWESRDLHVTLMWRRTGRC